MRPERGGAFGQHSDAKVVRSLPRLGTDVGAGVLGEFVDNGNRYADVEAVARSRFARNRRLAGACYLWAFAALTASPGARTFYDQWRQAGDTPHRGPRALANRLVGAPEHASRR